jgi:type VI secretion system protein ImpJ
MFLRPQHFQQQALVIDQAAAQTLRQTHAFPWGVRKAVADEDALRAGQLRLAALDVVFQDGLHVDAPGAEPLPAARNLDDIPGLGTEAVIFACVPTLNAFGGNGGEPGSASARPPRFTYDQVSAADLYTSALEAEITVMRVNLRLMLDAENRDGHLCLPIARIAKNATGVWTIDEQYVPPLIAIDGSRALDAMARQLLDIMLVKSQALAAAHRERTKSVVEFGTSDIASFWLLHTVNRGFPLLRHLIRTAPHPEVLYTALAQLCGELITFSSSITLDEIPAYDHRNLTEVFAKLDGILRELLDTVISKRYMLIPLSNPRPAFFIGHLGSDNLVDNADFYLSVSGDLPVSQLLEILPLRLKVGSPDDVEKILNSALPGVRLQHLAQTPAALPVRVGNHYFALENQGQIYERMLKARSICIYVPQALIQVKLELIAVFR